MTSTGYLHPLDDAPAHDLGPDTDSEPIPEDCLDPDDSSVKFLDSVNAGKYKKLTARQLHEMLGHFGPCPWGCSMCMQVKKAMN